MNKIFKSIKSQMILFFTSILLFSAFLQMFLTSTLSETLYINKVQHELETVYSILNEDFIPTKASIYEKMSVYEDELNLRILITDDNGQILYSTMTHQVDPNLLQMYSYNEGHKEPNFNHVPKVSINESFHNKSQSISVQGSLDTTYGKYFIILETPVASITESIQTVSRFTFSATIIALIIGTLITYFFSTKFSKPLKQISDVANSITHLDFSKKAQVSNNGKEIDLLAQNINTMSKNIEKMIVDLKIANIELKKDNHLRKQVDDMRREFIANVSHELKTPLSLLQGYSEILKSDTQGIDKNFYLDVIIDESINMNTLVNRLLNITSIENGLTKLNYEKFDLSKLLEWILSKNEILTSEIEIKSNITNECIVFADKLLVEQAITNYLSNAKTYAKTAICIELLATQTNYQLNVTNDGEPIEEPDKIWHSFYREDKSRTRTKDKNFGLGLYIVRTIITAHEGTYSAKNTKEGVTFSFTLPKNNDNIIV